MCDVQEETTRDKAYLNGATAQTTAKVASGAMSPAPPTMARLRARAITAANDADNANRALDILSRHPEYEDFAWLLRSGLVVLLMIAGCCVPTYAQQQPQTTPAQVEIQKEAELLSSQTQLLYEKLHGLQEFQDYLADLQKMQQLQQRYQAAAAKPEVKPKAEPVKPEAPVNPQPTPTTK